MDEFSDDGFDELNDTVLQELEDRALQLTQAPKQAPTQAPTRAPTNDGFNFDDDFDDDDLDDTVVVDEHAQPPPRPPPPPQSLPAQQPRPPHGRAPGPTQRWNQPPHLPPARIQQYPPSRPAPQPQPSQRYPAGPSQRLPVLPPPRPPARPQQQPQPQQPPRQSQFARPPQPIPAGATNQNEIIAALQARLVELQSDLTDAKGEAAILRSRYEKSRAAHEADVARLKKEAAEQLAKQERLAEQARAAERTVATELQFARQDLREGLGRAKARRKDAPGTPKKDRTWGMADGFDGVELLSSPTKAQTLRRKDPAGERTPTKGKRKRPTVDSPSFALETDTGDALFGEAHASTPPLPPTAHQPWPVDFLRLFLDHAASRGQPPTFDAFSHYAFPSDPKRSLASIVFHQLPQMGKPGEPLRLLVDFADLLIELWHRCLTERYYEPIYYLAALLSYALELNTVDVAPHVISSLIPVCATTCRLVALPRLHGDGDLSEHSDAVTQRLRLNIDVVQCLSLLYLAALGCLPRPLGESGPADAQTEFWRTMELEFALTMLSPKHPEADWMAMMLLLRTSAAPDSIGPIPSTTDLPSGRTKVRSPAEAAATVIDCVSSFLRDSPRWAAPGSAKETAVRSAALGTLAVFATSPFGALHLAQSDVAIPRLVAVLCWAIDRLYDAELPMTTAEFVGTSDSLTEPGDQMDVDRSVASETHAEGDGPMAVEPREANARKPKLPDLPEEEPPPEELTPDPMTVLCQIIAQATWLLHFLATDPRTADAANIPAKLAASHGGSQRYYLALARLNFAEEDLVLEAGIDAETVERAHELLELAVTPDEGDEISELFD